MKHDHRLTAKGQVTIPKDIRDVLGLEPGHRVAFLRNSDGTVQVVKGDEQQDQTVWLDRLQEAQQKFGGKDRFGGMDGLAMRNNSAPESTHASASAMCAASTASWGAIDAISFIRRRKSFAIKMGTHNIFDKIRHQSTNTNIRSEAIAAIA